MDDEERRDLLDQIDVLTKRIESANRLLAQSNNQNDDMRVHLNGLKGTVEDLNEQNTALIFECAGLRRLLEQPTSEQVKRNLGF